MCFLCQKKRTDAWVRRFIRERGAEAYRVYKAECAKRVYWNDPEKRRVYARKGRLKLRNELLEAYGGRCTCCGEDEAAFLTLEHKRRDGKAHRSKLSGGRNNSWSEAVYRDLKRRGWPKRDYTLLCFNCNHATWKLGICPHKKRKIRGKTKRVD